MNHFEFQAFTSMNCHQSHSIQMERRGGHLSQVSFFCQQDQLTHTIKCSLNRQSPTDAALITHEVQKLPNGD
jgi:hypothetical protein